MGATVVGTLGGAEAAVGGRIIKVGLENLRGTGRPLPKASRADRRIVWPMVCCVFCLAPLHIKLVF